MIIKTTDRTLVSKMEIKGEGCFGHDMLSIVLIWKARKIFNSSMRIAAVKSVARIIFRLGLSISCFISFYDNKRMASLPIL